MKPKNLRLISLLLALAVMLGLCVGCHEEESGRKKDSPSQSDAAPTVLAQEAFSGQTVTDRDQALDAISLVADQLNISDPAGELTECREQTYCDISFYRFAQSYQGVRVYGRDVILAADAQGQVQALTHNYQNVDGLDIEPALSQEQARKAVGEAYPEVTGLLDMGLCIYSLEGIQPTLTWQFQVSGPGVMELCFVDAHTGKVVTTQSLMLAENATGTYTDDDGQAYTFNTDRGDDGTYTLRDNVRNITVYDSSYKIVSTNHVVDEFGEVYVGKNGRWRDSRKEPVTLANPQYLNGEDCWNILYEEDVLFAKHAVYRPFIGNAPLEPVENVSRIWNNKEAALAMYAVEQAYDMFSKAFEKNGFNGASGHTMVCVNDMCSITALGFNAYSIHGDSDAHTFLVFGAFLPITYDLVGHEYSHSVEQSICGMKCRGQTRSIQEGMADVFGELLEDYAPDQKWDNSCNWIYGKLSDFEARCPKDPLLSNNPFVYKGKHYDSKGTLSASYTNSTIISHACYRMTHPEAPGVEALGNHDLGRLLMMSMQFFPSDCNFFTFSEIVLNSAQLMGLPLRQQMAVYSALYAAGIVPEDCKLNLVENTVDYLVAPNATWQILDENGNPCENYTVAALDLFELEEIYADEDINYTVKEEVIFTATSSDPLNLDLTPGYVYLLTITDGRDASRSLTCLVGVTQTGGKTGLIQLAANFTPAPPQSPADTRPTAESYAAVVREIMLRCNYDQASNMEKGNGQGVLMDINGDGEDELLVQSCYKNKYYLEVWGKVNGTVTQMMVIDDMLYGLYNDVDNFDLSLSQKDGCQYLIYHYYFLSHQAPKEYYDIYLVETGQITKSYHADFRLGDGFYINDDNVEYQEYENFLAQFQNQETALAVDYFPELRTPQSKYLPELLAACERPQTPADTRPTAESYAAVVRDVMARCENPYATEQEKKNCQGALLDINGDGKDELLIQGYDGDEFQFEVWAQQDGYVVQLLMHKGSWHSDWAMNQFTLILTQKDGVPYLIYYSFISGTTSCFTSYTFYRVEQTQITNAHSIYDGQDGYYSEEDGIYGNFYCYIDGKGVTYEEYDAFLAQFQPLQTVLSIDSQPKLWTPQSKYLPELLAACGG